MFIFYHYPSYDKLGSAKIHKSKIFARHFVPQAPQSVIIAEPNKIWLAIPPALKCLRNEENAKNMLESIFFTRRFVSERKQISLIADEKSPARISHRRFATKSLRNEDYYDRYYWSYGRRSS